MRDRVEVIHGAVDRIDDPLQRAVLIARDALFTVDGVGGKLGEQEIGDELLRAHIEVELDVVRFKRIHVQRLAEVSAKQFAGCLRGANGG